MMTKQTTTERPLLSPEKRDAYLKAITELVGSVGLHESTPIHADSFCEKHGLKPSFLDALRDLNGLEMDFMKPCTDGMIFFKKTPTLYQIEPEAILRQMRATGSVKGKEARRKEVEEEEPGMSLLPTGSCKVALTFFNRDDNEPAEEDAGNEAMVLTGTPAADEPELSHPAGDNAEPVVGETVKGVMEQTADQPEPIASDISAGMVPKPTEPPKQEHAKSCKGTCQSALTVSGADIVAAFERAGRQYDDLQSMAKPTPTIEKQTLPFLEKLADINRLYNKAGMLSGQLFDVMVEINALNQTA